MVSALVLVVAGACPAGVFCNTSGPPTTATLSGAALISPTDAWVVGQWGAALHWDGAAWQVSPTGSKDRLSAVVALGPKDVWAVGSSSVLHFDGAWHEVVSQNPSVYEESRRVAVQPRKGVIWILGHSPSVIEGGTVSPLTGPATALMEEGEVLSAAVCGPNQLWSIARARSGGLTVQHWNGEAVRVLRQPFRINDGKVVCVGDVAWISTDETLFSCTTSSGCELVPAPREARLVEAPFGPLVISEGRLFVRRKDDFRELGTVPSGVFAGVASSIDRVLLHGSAGVVTWFLGAAAQQPAMPLTMGTLTSVAATPDGRAWASSAEGLFAWNGTRWARDASFALKPRQPIALAASGSELWATTDGQAFRFEGGWKSMTDGSVAIRGVFVRGKDDVFGFGRETLRHWNGRAWTEVTKVKPGLSWVALAGTSTVLYGLARGDHSWTSRRTTDELLVLELDQPPKWLEAPARSEGLAVVRGEVWTWGGMSLSRLVGDTWLPVADGVIASLVVPTQRGAVLLSGNHEAMEWDGKQLTPLQLPGVVEAGTSVGATSWLVGHETALRRGP